MRQTHALIAGTIALGASTAFAAPIPLFNAGFEPPDQTSFGLGAALDGWGPNGGYADHLGFSKPNNGSLGSGFGFYTPVGELVAQATGFTITPGLYTFEGWATGGGNGVGDIAFAVGYDNGTGDITVDNDGDSRAAPIELSEVTFFGTADYSTTGSWQALAGVTASAPGAALGKELIVAIVENQAGNPDDIWFDELSASYVIPQPGSAAMILAGTALLAGRRRRN